METATATTPRMIALVQLLLTLTVALLLGALLTQSVDAAPRKPHKPSIGARIQNQKELCAVDGGSFGVQNSGGQATTSCSGGSQGDWSCTNSRGSTHCEGLRTQPPSGGIVAPHPGGAGTGPDGNNSGNPLDGIAAPPSGGVSG